MSEKYLGEVSTPLLINQIKENCAQKRTTLPIASVDELGHIYQYMGATSGSLVHGYFYECVSDGQNPATYSWQQVNTQPTVTPTASGTTFNNATSGLQATNVQDAIDEVVGDLGTAASKDFTTNVAPNNHSLVESNAVYSAINNALTSVYTPRGNIACADLTSSLLIASNVGNVYNTTDSGTTTALFMQGAGIPIPQNSTVGIIQTSPNTYLFNLMGNTIDLHDYQKKDLTQAVEGQTTVEGALGALSTNNQATQAEVNDMNNVLGAKNILSNEVTTNNNWHGVSRTVNADGTITLNGTSTAWDFANFNYVQGQKLIPTGTYIISGGCENTALAVVADGSVIARQYGAGETTFTITDNMVETYARFEMSTDKTFTSESSIIKPMIRLASDPDNTYVPYVPTNAKLNEEKMSYADNGVLGAKNLAKPINSISYLDITVVCDANGVLSITGTASGSGGRLNIVSDSFMLKAGTYKVVHTSNDLTKYSSMVCHKKSDNTSLGYSLIDNGTIDNSHAQFTLASDTECFMGMNTYQGTNYGTDTGTKEYVMVVLADDTDTTYQPYAPTNRECMDYKTNGILGAHNLLLRMDLERIKAANSTATWTNNVGVAKGITITVNDDGTFTVSGTATGRVAFTIVTSSRVDWLDGLYGKELILSGSIANTQLNIWDNTSSIYYAYTGNGEESDIFHIPENNHTILVEFVIGNGNTVNGTIQPIVRLASDTDKTFQPYAKTNKELTDVTQITTLTQSEVFSSIESGYTVNDLAMYKQGKHVWGTLVLSKDSGDLPSSQATVATLKLIPRASMNSWCVCSGNRYGGSPFYVGYMWAASGNGQILICNPSGTTSGVNTAKIMLDYCID